jgi:NADP-dependent 3-hydroxy acid dehydrogenase YdfG
MKTRHPEVVVITGATAGIGRATVREFARHGASIALLAREPERLEATRVEVEQMGGKAIGIPTDMADYEQVEAAAERVERELGPIDIWVNDAMATIFAPVDRIAPEDFRRVTDVTYHGFVWGTMAALKRMRPRNRGTIVQVGSARA